MQLLDAYIGLLCHQIPERSPRFAGAVFPLCYRCSGLYLGMLFAYLRLGISGAVRWRLPSNRAAAWLGAAMLPLFVDGWGNFFGLWDTPGPARALTGLAVGLALPHFLLPLVQPLSAGIGVARGEPTLRRAADLAWPAVGAAAALGLLLHPVFTWIFRGLALTAGASLTLFLCNFAVAAGVWAWRDRYS